MKKSIKKATVRRTTRKIVRVVVNPLTDLIHDFSENARRSKIEKKKLEKLEKQKALLKSEINSKKNIMKHKNMLLPEKKAQIEAELKTSKSELNDIQVQYLLILGKRADRKKKKIVAYLLLLALCTLATTVSYLITTGIMTVLGF